MFAFDWFRISNKYDFRPANRFEQREVFKFFITKDSQVRNDDFVAIPMLLLFKSLNKAKKVSIKKKEL